MTSQETDGSVRRQQDAGSNPLNTDDLQSESLLMQSR